MSTLKWLFIVTSNSQGARRARLETFSNIKWMQCRLADTKSAACIDYNKLTQNVVEAARRDRDSSGSFSLFPPTSLHLLSLRLRLPPPTPFNSPVSFVSFTSSIFFLHLSVPLAVLPDSFGLFKWPFVIVGGVNLLSWAARPRSARQKGRGGRGDGRERKRGSVGMKREEEMKGGGTGEGKGDLKRENKSSLRFKWPRESSISRGWYNTKLWKGNLWCECVSQW